MKIKALVQLAVLVAVVLSLALAHQPAQVGAGADKILQFDTMVGVPPAFVASAGRPIMGVNGAGLPWVIGPASGELRVDGKLELSFTGLVFDPNDPTVVERGLANRNTVAVMKAVVACNDGTGATVQVSSPNFAVTTGFASEGGGSGSVEALLDLPSPCIAPVVFITNLGGSWFAATGR